MFVCGCAVMCILMPASACMLCLCMCMRVSIITPVYRAILNDIVIYKISFFMNCSYVMQVTSERSIEDYVLSVDTAKDAAPTTLILKVCKTCTP